MGYSGRETIQIGPYFCHSPFRSAAIIFGVAARTLLGNVSSERYL